jgi:hypothetical protein
MITARLVPALSEPRVETLRSFSTANQTSMTIAPNDDLVRAES